MLNKIKFAPADKELVHVIGAYIVFGSLWILFSDRLLSAMVRDPEVYRSFQTYNGVFFIGITAALLYCLIQRLVRKRRVLESDVRRGEEKFQTLVERSLAGIYIIQGDRFSYVNDRFAEIFGYAPAEITGEKTPADLVSSEDRETVLRNLRARSEGKLNSAHYSFRGLRKDGRIVD